MAPINFPVTGNSGIMAIVILVHVFGAFIAVGSMGLCVATEWWGMRRKDDDYVKFARSLSHFMSDFMKLNGVLGVLIIFLLIGLWGPFTELLYGVMFWVFVLEGIFFMLLLSCAVSYERGASGTRQHLITGVAALAFAVLAAFLINGIWAFMLSPGDWLITRKRGDAFFNPLLFSSFFHLIIPCFINAAMAAFIWSWWREAGADEAHVVGYYRKINRFSARCAAAMVFLQPLSGLHFFFSVKSVSESLADPTPYWQISMGQATHPFRMMAACAVTAVLCAIAYWMIGHKRGRCALGIAAFALALAFVGGAYTREKARKPYLIQGYMTMDMTTREAAPEPLVKGPEGPAESDTPKPTPVEKPSQKTNVSGETVYNKYRCVVCHKIAGKGGSNGPKLKGLQMKYTPQSLKDYLMKPPFLMPAFEGSPAELDALVEFLHQEAP